MRQSLVNRNEPRPIGEVIRDLIERGELSILKTNEYEGRQFLSDSRMDG